jgi:hypothetical protein
LGLSINCAAPRYAKNTRKASLKEIPTAIAAAERKPFLMLVCIKANKAGPTNNIDIENPNIAPLKKVTNICSNFVL